MKKGAILVLSWVMWGTSLAHSDAVPDRLLSTSRHLQAILYPPRPSFQVAFPPGYKVSSLNRSLRCEGISTRAQRAGFQ
ncbi:hypothetical protein FA13DRAFT_1731489 [Coprinellus micaceus]|uniref:Uncharacterized protein n=1 Tax=Coprinellus micaceus TaxID=71717 RepID=A0A4Y7TDR1_COPMI|nr:hypothetical protein FA13DRAFT_1731489 [Coprinellus micaceus]